MRPALECWAEALFIERVHGADAPRYIAEQIGSLALRGDGDGISRWKEIAMRLDMRLDMLSGAARVMN